MVLLIITAKVVRKELHTYRDSLIYHEMESLLGTILAELLNRKILTPKEEQTIRRIIFQ